MISRFFIIGSIPLGVVGNWNSWPVEEYLYTFQDFYRDAQYGPDFGYYSLGSILNSEREEFFNSYTTYPMALSPFFARVLASKLEGMWVSMNKPSPFYVFEFGGGGGQLARDISAFVNQTMPAFRESLRYTIGDRSKALRQQQRRTLRSAGQGDFVTVREGDATEASKLRPENVTKVEGVIISNELLDEFDPIKLRLVWDRSAKGHNRAEIVEQCDSWREMYLIQCFERDNIDKGHDMFETESRTTLCSYLDSVKARSLIGMIIPKLTDAERIECFPNAICCSEFLVALAPLGIGPPNTVNLERLLRDYRKALAQKLICVSKQSYRMLRRRLPNIDFFKIKNTELALGLRPERCEQLTPFFKRHAARFAKFIRVYDTLYMSGENDDIMGSWKWIHRPGEDLFAKESSKLIDRGYMLTIDYGADMESLLWHQAIRPNYDGISIMDARRNMHECSNSELSCPGMQDMTTSVDFTNFALAGKEHDWVTLKYSNLKEVERAFGYGPQYKPMHVHLIEQAGGPRHPGIWNWYKTQEGEPWASFKILIQKKGVITEPPGILGMNSYALIPEETDTCWNVDISMPPMMEYFTRGKTHAIVLGQLRQNFDQARESRNPPFYVIMDRQEKRQRSAYNDMHLSLLLTDYWMYYIDECRTFPSDAAIAVWDLGISRRLPDIYGMPDFTRVFNNVHRVMNGTFTLDSTYGQPSYPPYICMSLRAVESYCSGMRQVKLLNP